MKLQFEPDLDFQVRAIDAVCDLFRGQEPARDLATGASSAGSASSLLRSAGPASGSGNHLALDSATLEKNLHDVQKRNGIVPSTSVESLDFTVEMETGTGKTYVYLRTIYELNRRYGFSKFLVVVPSIAIKEGVYKALQTTEEHFKSLFSGTPADYYLYDSRRLGHVRNFASSARIQIMVITVGAINKSDINNLYKENERTYGEPPVSLIQGVRPIVIVDEPQSVDGGLAGRGRQALRRMEPLCTLRYSATHVDEHHMVYRLDAVDAYEQGLVKKIEIASASIDDAVNRPYVRVVSANYKGGVISTRLELLDGTRGRISRRVRTVRDGDDLESLTAHSLYRGHRVGEICLLEGYRFVELIHPDGATRLAVGDTWGDVDDAIYNRQMIRRTIREHLTKEARLLPQGIKVLTLFFVDAVEKYRAYDASGGAVKGEYARIFEEEYETLARLPEFRTVFSADGPLDASDVHEGYFSIDRKGGWTDTNERNQAGRDAAERAYNLIMREKEALLALTTPLRFLFSHSALREGWDNPNVFQICALRDIRGTRQRRQTIGRGLRLCVNQQGERVRADDINTLTVVASESYEEFAATLQRELEAEIGVRFGIVERRDFAAIRFENADGEATTIGAEGSAGIWAHLHDAGYISARGEISDSLRRALRDRTLTLPDEWLPQRPEIERKLSRIVGKPQITDASARRTIAPRPEVLEDPEFHSLWSRIKHKTIYRLHFDSETLIRNCTEELRHGPAVPSTTIRWTRAGVGISRSGVEIGVLGEGGTVSVSEGETPLPDVLNELQSRSDLSRGDVCRIILESGRLEDFRRNPRRFIETAADAIRSGKRKTLGDGIKYERRGKKDYYSRSLFKTQELHEHLAGNLLAARKSIYHSVVCDSETEKKFAQGLENHESVKLYAKLPPWFRIPTPLGSYNPDWAVLVRLEGEERLYFVVETKGSVLSEDLRLIEKWKIECGRKHFEAIGRGANAARFVVGQRVQSLFAPISRR